MSRRGAMTMPDPFRLADLTDAEWRALAAKLDRLTARFAYAVIAAFAVLFAFHAFRFAVRMVAA